MFTYFSITCCMVGQYIKGTDRAVFFVVALFAVRTDRKQGNNLQEPRATTHFCPVYYNQTLKSLKQKNE